MIAGLSRPELNASRNTDFGPPRKVPTTGDILTSIST